MKIVIASDSYKGSFSSEQVSDAIEKGIKKVISNATIIKVLVGDGGEKTLEAIIKAKAGYYNKMKVINPLGKEIIAKYGVLDNHTAIVEMATASGLGLIKPSELKPLETTTYGTGQLINDALNRGFKKIYVGLGGSATNDGGVGMAMALGVKFYDIDSQEIGFGNKELIKIESIDITDINPLIYKSEIIGLYDVSNPLYGKDGAASVFAPQKGANAKEVVIIDNNLRHYSKKIKDVLNIDVSNQKGAGAAGGLGAGLLAFCNAKLVSGSKHVLELIELEKHIVGADLVITGEGKIDGQTIYGKTPIGVSQLAKKHNVFTLAIVGSVGEGADKAFDHGIDMIVSIINKPMTINEAFSNVDSLIQDAASMSIKTFLKLRNNNKHSNN